eukprot:749258-Hanusia_phi.AAC.2
MEMEGGGGTRLESTRRWRWKGRGRGICKQEEGEYMQGHMKLGRGRDLNLVGYRYISQHKPSPGASVHSCPDSELMASGTHEDSMRLPSSSMYSFFLVPPSHHVVLELLRHMLAAASQDRRRCCPACL